MRFYRSLQGGHIPCQNADERIAYRQHQLHASQTVLINGAAIDARLTCLLVSGRPDRVASDDHCLVLPDASTAPALVVVTSTDSTAGQLLASLPNARAATAIPVPGGASFASFSVSGVLPRLNGETAVVPTVFKRSGDGDIALRLDALSAAPTTRTRRLRWTVLSPGLLRPAPDSVRFSTRHLTTSGGLGPSAGYHDC
jgi:hypothetical protein